MYIKYDKITKEVLGFLVNKEDNCIEVDSDVENKLLSMQTKGTLFIKDIDKKEFEVRQTELLSIPKNETEIRLEKIQNALDYLTLK